MESSTLSGFLEGETPRGGAGHRFRNMPSGERKRLAIATITICSVDRVQNTPQKGSLRSWTGLHLFFCFTAARTKIGILEGDQTNRLHPTKAPNSRLAIESLTAGSDGELVGLNRNVRHGKRLSLARATEASKRNKVLYVSKPMKVSESRLKVPSGKQKAVSERYY
jgi:hypothetical protein